MSMISVNANDLEHLLNCMANQKFLPMTNEQSDAEKASQEIIDKAYHAMRDNLHRPRKLSIEQARAIAGTAWCGEKTSGTVLDPDLAKEFAEILIAVYAGTHKFFSDPGFDNCWKSK